MKMVVVAHQNQRPSGFSVLSGLAGFLVATNEKDGVVGALGYHGLVRRRARSQACKPDRIAPLRVGVWVYRMITYRRRAAKVEFCCDCIRSIKPSADHF